jgi:metallo-beta-lactamase family protein
MPTINIHFLGGAGTVTGSKHLIETKNQKILVDCGLFQGLKSLRLMNWENLPILAHKIDCVILTHGHLDHVGYLPLLVKQGFRGNIYANAPTIEIAKLILQDSARIQEEDAKRANEKGYSKHHPAKPLYTSDDVEKVFPLFQICPLSEWNDMGDNYFFRFRNNAHILGSCFIELKIEDKLLVFSGDIGRSHDPLMFAPEKPTKADILFVESTYGNRIHPIDAEESLIKIIKEAFEDKGTIIIPSFAVERTQLLMFLLWKLKKEKKIPQQPIYMDSPMGTNVLKIFQKYPQWHKLDLAICNQVVKEIELIENVQDTYRLAEDTSPKIIIAGSGMATGGRVLTYFEHHLGNPQSTILLSGYQAEGTRGRALLEGAKEIKLHGKHWEVKAKIRQIEGFSAHADQHGLIEWMSDIMPSPQHIFIIHGEKESAEGLQKAITEKLGWKSQVAGLQEKVKIEL